MKRLTGLFLLCLPFAYNAVAQNDAILRPTLLYKKYYTIGANINTRGWGLNFKYGFQKTEDRSSQVIFDFARLRHEKEIRVVNPAFENPKSYVFGRLNQTFALRLGAAQKVALSKRMYRKAVTVSFNYAAGFSAAVLKPVYLDIFTKTLDNPAGEIHQERYDPAIHTDQSSIYGSSSFDRGLDEISFRPGGFAKCSFTFDWGEDEEDFKTVETGVCADIYPEPLPIMAFTKNHMLFLNVYIALSLGNRW